MPHRPRFVAVGEVMTSRVRTGSPHQGLVEIWHILNDEGCHHVPIVEDGVPVGMITARDLVRAAHQYGSRRPGVSEIAPRLPENVLAGDVMSTQLETIQVDASVDVAIDRIGRGDIHALVVLDEHAQLAGIVTNHDLLQYLAE